MSDRIHTAAVIGLGKMGAEPSKRAEGDVPNGWLPLTHLEAMLTNPQLSVQAICDIDRAKCERFSSHYNIRQFFTDYKELLDKMRPEFISIATRTENRLDIINEALDKDVRGIYCEKPFSRNIGTAKKVLERAERQNVKIGYGTNRRYVNIYRQAKELIHSGELGAITEITIENGNGQLLWVHPHSTDLLLFLADTTDIEFIQGRCTFSDETPTASNGVIDDDPYVDHAFFKFKNGMNGIINKTGGFNTRIGCTRGLVTIYSNGFMMEVRKSAPSEVSYFNVTKQVLAEPSASGTQNAFNEMIRALDGEEKMPISPLEILRGMQMLFGIVQSSLNNGRPIRIEDIDDSIIITGRTGTLYA